MTDTPAGAQDVAPVWYKVDRRALEGAGDDWEDCCLGDNNTDDPLQVASDVMDKHATGGKNGYRVRVYGEPNYLGEPLVERYSPAELAPWVIPPAKMANPEPGVDDAATGGGTHPGGDAPKLTAVPPDVDTLEKLLAFLKASDLVPGEAPGSLVFKLGEGIPLDALPQAIQDKLRALVADKLEDISQRHHKESEQDLIQAGFQLMGTIAAATKEAKDNREGTDWYTHADILEVIAVEAANFTLAYTRWKLG
jgi:hypothetical protein